MKIEYFTAAWCQPCKIYGPIVDRVMAETPVVYEKIDIDKSPERLPPDVMGVPTVIMYQDGEEISRIVGARGEDDFRGWLARPE